MTDSTDPNLAELQPSANLTDGTPLPAPISSPAQHQAVLSYQQPGTVAAPTQLPTLCLLLGLGGAGALVLTLSNGNVAGGESLFLLGLFMAILSLGVGCWAFSRRSKLSRRQIAALIIGMLLGTAYLVLCGLAIWVANHIF